MTWEELQAEIEKSKGDTITYKVFIGGWDTPYDEKEFFIMDGREVPRFCQMVADPSWLNRNLSEREKDMTFLFDQRIELFYIMENYLHGITPINNQIYLIHKFDSLLKKYGYRWILWEYMYSEYTKTFAPYLKTKGLL